MFTRAVEALKDARPGDAVLELEAIADRGVVDPVVSFDRGLAYAERVRASGEQPGDLGRAAHAFEEARLLTDDEPLERDALTALTAIRTEVARRSARSGANVAVEPNPPIGEVLVQLLPEDAWAVIAILLGCVVGLGFFVRATSEKRRAKITGSAAVAVAAPLLVATALLTWSARDDRLHRFEGVIVNPNARPSDARGVALASAPSLPEGARVRILAVNAGWSEIAWGSLRAWVPTPAVRPLARRG